jgi:hypothetical protein
VSWRQQNSNRIDLIADRDDYSVGDTAEILITSPFQGTTEALITVERGQVLSVERVTMNSNSYIYELPITADHAPNIFVGALLIRGIDDNNPVAGFRMGYIQLGVDVNQKVLDIDISANTDRAQPQEVVTYTVRTTDYAGNPVQSELGIGVTDLAALSLAPDNSRPIVNYYYGDQSLAVRTGTPLTIYTDQLTQETLDTVKGGGGGVALSGLIEIRGEFIDTPYWNGALETNANGEATFDVRLPDNLTTWRLNARALSLAPDGNMLVGQETFDLLSTRPLIVRPVTPRFFVVGDEVLLSAVINNNTESEQQVVVTLEQSGFTLNSDPAQIVTIPAEGRARVSWDVVVNDVDQVNAVFTADAGNFTDGSISPVSMDDEGNLPVYRYEVPETVGTAGTLTAADSRFEAIVLPRRFEVTQGELVVNVDKSLAVTTLDGLDYLRNYPHQCIEQTVSRFLPNIMTYRALNNLGVADVTLQNNLETAVSASLQKLLAEQKSSGGWGWFVSDDGDPLTTAYAVIGLHEAQQQGYNVPSPVITRAQGFVQNNIMSLNMSSDTWQLNRQAFMLYALARSGSADVARTSNLFELRDGLSQYAKAYLALTLHTIDDTDLGRINTLMDDIMSNAIVSAAGIHWEEDRRDYRNWNTDLRTTAIVLEALVTLRPESELIPNVVRYLMVQRTADAWETTQETAWSVMALTNWMQVSDELNPDYSYTVTLNDETLVSGTATPGSVRDSETLRLGISDLLQDEANDLIFTRTGSDNGSMYYTAYLEAYLPVPEVEPLDSGISIQRRYTRPGSDDPITEGRAGEVIEVHLTIIAPSDLNYVVIEDPLPAGAEAINPDLEISQQEGTRPGLDNNDPLRDGWGWWYFSEIEFRDEKVNLYSTYLPAGTYEYRYTMRLSVEGTYNVIPPTAEEFYFPDVYGRGGGASFTVLPAEG